MRGCRGVEELAVTFLAMAVCALSLAWRLPVGVRTEVRVLEALRHAAFAWLPTGHCECDLCVPSAGGHAAEWLDGRVSPCFGVSCVQLGSAAHASHAAHRVIQGTGAELKDYDNVLTLPKLGAHGQLENAAHSSSHLVKLGAERAAQDVDSYFASLEKQVRFPERAIAAVHLFTYLPVWVQVIAVPTGRQRYNAPPPSHLKPSAADTAAPSSSSSDEATKEAIAAAKALEASSSSAAATALPSQGAGERGITSDAARLKAELRQLSQAVNALKHSPRTQATKVYYIYKRYILYT